MENKENYMNFEDLAQLVLLNDQYIPIVGMSVWADFCKYVSSPLDQKQEESFNRGTEYLKTQLKSDKNTKEQKQYIQQLLQLTDDLSKARQNPDTPDAQAFVDRLKNISRMYYVNGGTQSLLPDRAAVLEPMPKTANDIENMRLMMLQKFNQLQNEEAKHKLLKFLSKGIANESSPASQKMAITFRANSPLATVHDLEVMSYITPQHDVATFKKLYEDADKMTSTFLAKELAKESPNMQEVQQTIEASGRIAYRAQQAKAITGAQYQEHLNKYKMENLMMPDAVSYMQKLSTAEVAQIDALKKQLAEMQAKLEKTQQELSQERTALMDSKSRNEELTRENESLRRTNDSLGQSKENAEDKLKKLVAGAKRMKSGLGSSGVKDYQKMAEEIGMGMSK